MPADIRQMYETYFGLRERPFNLSPDPEYLFLGGRYREALSTLRYALDGPRGLTLLIGEAGTGKTTLVQAALNATGEENAECVLLSNPTLTRDEFYEFLAKAFRLSEDAAHSKVRFLSEFRLQVEERHMAGKITALLIDEAQSLPYELLEEIRLLGNIESATTKFLTIVLVGQPELAERLNENRLRQLKQRIGLRCELGPLSLAEAAGYIAGRLRIAGGVPTSIFTRNAVEAINQGARGVPRVINVIADNALITGFASQIRPVSRAVVEDVLRDFDLAHSGASAATSQGAAESILVPPASDHAGLMSPAADARPSAPAAEGEAQQGRSLFGTFRRFSFF